MMTQITFHITVTFSPDENIWYLEDQNPDCWRFSKAAYETESQAIDAYKAGEVEWEEI